jgi:Fe2+ transport system protein FeoA
MKQQKSIFEMNVGEQGTIISMDQIAKNVRHRFMDLGIAPFAKIVLLNTINFNQLYVIEVDDVEICIRKKDALNIQVEV